MQLFHRGFDAHIFEFAHYFGFFFDLYMALFSSDCVIHFHSIENGKWVSNASML